MVKPGDKVLNLGMQFGMEAIIMGKITQPEGRLYLFEPYPFSHKLLTKNIDINGMSNMATIYKYGASDWKSKGAIKVAYRNTGASEIIPVFRVKPNNYFNETEYVEIDRVDVLLPADVSLDFALIDVEKMEVKALRGMREAIERSTRLILMVNWQY